MRNPHWLEQMAVLLRPRPRTLARTQAWAAARAGKAFTLDGRVVGEGWVRKLLRTVGIG
jgi:hypothetical protein